MVAEPVADPRGGTRVCTTPPPGPTIPKNTYEQWWQSRFLSGVAKLGFVGRKKSEIFPGIADYRKAQVFHTSDGQRFNTERY